MLKSLHHAGTKLEMLHIKLWRIIKESSILRAFNLNCILVYCGLYTMTIDVVTWRIIKKWCIWSLHLLNFLFLPVFALFLQKLRRLSLNFSNFIYMYLKLKLGTEKHIRLKWVFLPQRTGGHIEKYTSSVWGLGLLELCGNRMGNIISL